MPGGGGKRRMSRSGLIPWKKSEKKASGGTTQARTHKAMKDCERKKEWMPNAFSSEKDGHAGVRNSRAKKKKVRTIYSKP